MLQNILVKRWGFPEFITSITANHCASLPLESKSFLSNQGIPLPRCQDLIVGSHRITEHAEAITLFGFKYPPEMSAAISDEFQ